MKTKAVLDKYQRIIGGILGVDPGRICFQILEAGKWQAIGEDLGEDDKDKPGERNWCLGEYRVTSYGGAIAHFKLYQMPHCCGIIVSCNASVEPQHRHKRIGTVLNNLRQDIGRGLGYSVMICTDIKQNEHQRALLATNNWQDILEFKNKRTGNTVYLAYVML